MPYVEVSTQVAGSCAEVYPILKAMEKYPDFMQDLVSVTVLERQGQTTITHWISKVDGRMIKWTERDVFDDERYHISYSQIDGDLKKFEGEWILTPAEQGTEIKLTVDFEFGIPMIAGLLHPLLKRKVKENSMHMLEAIQERLKQL
ncbi:ribosome-associated toxin RatA of RatAB toxin-antitoxin module [Sporomusaceae bacterium BoRhaA]|uniref:type II toxin-antitoxin system RatA family toxin n=1 Tax=Pelorhabdus rhamnosifermentans TaxID=2772457 RepID=UPI001C0632A5|nr:aromatase/cyclase [Pelorhabdus rhamnosifermentans]MBU2701080.1 ribosome-associated toxin RatA of RatAB toxin-antitoxin module [Pelorhabdus rhamnosifermentans]